MRLGTYYRHLVSRQLDLPKSGNKILDIGCYDGFFLSHMDAIEKYGIDEDVRRIYPDIQYIEGNFMEYDFKNNKFDKIFAFEVLEHVKEDKAFLMKIVQLLTPDGMAILSTPSENIKIFPSVFQSWADKRWGHIYRRGYTTNKIRQMMEDVPEDITLDICYWNSPLFRIFYLPLSAFWRISSTLTKKIFNGFVKLEYRFKEGDRGFLYIKITRKK